MKKGDIFYYIEDGNRCQYRFLMPSLDCPENYFLADYGYGGSPRLLDFKDNHIFNSKAMAIEATIKYLSETLEVRKRELKGSILNDARKENNQTEVKDESL